MWFKEALVLFFIIHLQIKSTWVKAEAASVSNVNDVFLKQDGSRASFNFGAIADTSEARGTHKNVQKRNAFLDSYVVKSNQRPFGSRAKRQSETSVSVDQDYENFKQDAEQTQSASNPSAVKGNSDDDDDDNSTEEFESSETSPVAGQAAAMKPPKYMFGLLILNGRTYVMDSPSTKTKLVDYSAKLLNKINSEEDKVKRKDLLNAYNNAMTSFWWDTVKTIRSEQQSPQQTSGAPRLGVLQHVLGPKFKLPRVDKSNNLIINKKKTPVDSRRAIVELRNYVDINMQKIIEHPNATLREQARTEFLSEMKKFGKKYYPAGPPGSKPKGVGPPPKLSQKMQQMVDERNKKQKDKDYYDEKRYKLWLYVLAGALGLLVLILIVTCCLKTRKCYCKCHACSEVCGDCSTCSRFCKRLFQRLFCCQCCHCRECQCSECCTCGDLPPNKATKQNADAHTKSRYAQGGRAPAPHIIESEQETDLFYKTGPKSPLRP